MFGHIDERHGRFDASINWCNLYVVFFHIFFSLSFCGFCYCYFYQTNNISFCMTCIRLKSVQITIFSVGLVFNYCPLNWKRMRMRNKHSKHWNRKSTVRLKLRPRPTTVNTEHNQDCNFSMLVCSWIILYSVGEHK